ncbi:MAG: STAS domain-containing protein [Thermoleophilia bacterium]
MPRPLDVPHTIAGRANVLGPPFECSWTDGGLNAAWVHLTGELDIDTTPQLEQTLRDPDSQARLVVLDMRELAFMDSCGVHAIVNASARARQRGRRLVVLRGPPEVDRVFSLTGNSGDVESGDVDSGEPSVQALLRLGPEDGAS